MLAARRRTISTANETVRKRLDFNDPSEKRLYREEDLRETLDFERRRVSFTRAGPCFFGVRGAFAAFRALGEDSSSSRRTSPLRTSQASVSIKKLREKCSYFSTGHARMD